jgi:hypothetical protein
MPRSRLDGRKKKRADGAQDRDGGLRNGFIWVFQRTAVAVLIIAIGLQIPVIRRLPSPGVDLLTLLIFALAIYWLWRGIRNIELVRQVGEPWPDALWRTGYAHIGAAMLGVFFWISVFVLLNAGLRLLLMPLNPVCSTSCMLRA